MISIPIDSIHADYSWNCRKNLAANTSDVTEETGIDGLIASIAINGVTTPVVVRPLRATTKCLTQSEYELASGFQRLTAVRRLHEMNSETKELLTSYGILPTAFASIMRRSTHIPSLVRELDDYQMRAENLSENAVRHSIPPCDMVFAISELVKIHPDILRREIARLTNKSISHATELFRCVKLAEVYLPPGTLNKSQYRPISILEAWRTSNTVIAFDDMCEIARLSNLSDIVKAYKHHAGIEAQEGMKAKGVRGRKKLTDNYPLYLDPFIEGLVELVAVGAVEIRDPFFRRETILTALRMAGYKGKEDELDGTEREAIAVGAEVKLRAALSQGY